MRLVPQEGMNTTELARVAAHVHEKGCKFIVKGIMTPADAEKAARAGCDHLKDLGLFLGRAQLGLLLRLLRALAGARHRAGHV